MTTSVDRVDPGSFRDPDSRVFYRDGEVYRLLSEEGLRQWDEFSCSPLYAALVLEEKLVRTERVAIHDPPLVLATEPAAALRHERIPFVSYPYEWTFAMLQDAALLQLELLERALGQGFTLKDASPYNVQWRGTTATFADLGSFERYRDGDPWTGYRQFCALFLFPLLLEAYRGVPFQPWLRGSLEGITPTQCARLLPLRDRLRRGVLTHVVMHRALERRSAAGRRDSGEIRRELREAGFSGELITANVRRLRRLVARLAPKASQSPWSAYTPSTSYSPEDAARKAAFVERYSSSQRWRLVWDLGANDGRYTRLVARHAGYVVAIDADPVVVDGLYRALRDAGDAGILPLCVNLTDPSPGLGWRGRERRALLERGSPDLVVSLALVHHLAIGGNLPIAEIVDWLASLGGTLLVEFPTRDDPMVRTMLAGKAGGAHPDYTREWFERCLGERFTIDAIEELASGARVLYGCRRTR